MPQLDFIIIFPQIFWLIVIFFSLYTILIHFFLPKFIKIIKARKQIIITNSNILNNIKTNFDDKQRLLNKELEKNFFKIKLMLEKEIFPSFKKTVLINSDKVDSKLATTLYSNILYYDTTVLESILLRPNF